MLGTAERREFGFKRAHFGPENILAVIEHARDGGVDGIAHPAALRGKIDKGNSRKIGSHIHCRSEL
jgi:hypothetical protein